MCSQLKGAVEEVLTELLCAGMREGGVEVDAPRPGCWRSHRGAIKMFYYYLSTIRHRGHGGVDICDRDAGSMCNEGVSSKGMV